MKKRIINTVENKNGIAYNALSKINKNEVSRLELDTIEKICLKLECQPGELLELK